MTAPEIAAALARFVHPSQVTELRALHVGGKGRTFSGWFAGTHLHDLARNALAMTRQAAGVYFIPNPINPDLAAKRLNEVRNVPKGFALTTDEDVLERRFLIVDIDPRRFSDNPDDQHIPSTAGELVFARAVARDHVAPFLRSKGWNDPITMVSGNGIHLVYPLTAPVAVAGWGRAADPLAHTLRVLAERFACAGMTLDTNTYNPCRMLKVPGTIVRKGEATSTRPHREARILEIPDEWRNPTTPPGSSEPTQRSESNGKVGATKRTGTTNVHPSSPIPVLFDRGTDGSPVH